MNKQYVYLFEEGNKDMRDLLGGKGANLAEMTRIGLPVPAGMTITTEACKDYYDQGGELSSEVLEQVWTKLSEVEHASGKTFGDATDPLLVSVRSGAVISMPGMMDTVLNLGLNDQTIAGLIDRTPVSYTHLDVYKRQASGPPCPKSTASLLRKATATIR